MMEEFAPSFTGGSAGPSDADASVGQTVDSGGLFSPFYFGGSGGGMTSFYTLAILGLVLWWTIGKK